jgi:hypothetical protein
MGALMNWCFLSPPVSATRDPRTLRPRSARNLNAANAAGGGVVRLYRGASGLYKITSTLIVYSTTVIDARGATIRLIGSSGILLKNFSTPPAPPGTTASSCSVALGPRTTPPPTPTCSRSTTWMGRRGACAWFRARNLNLSTFSDGVHVRIGLMVYNTAAAKWKNVYTGVTS